MEIDSLFPFFRCWKEEKIYLFSLLFFAFGPFTSSHSVHPLFSLTFSFAPGDGTAATHSHSAHSQEAGIWKLEWPPSFMRHSGENMQLMIIRRGATAHPETWRVQWSLISETAAQRSESNLTISVKQDTLAHKRKPSPTDCRVCAITCLQSAGFPATQKTLWFSEKSP